MCFCFRGDVLLGGVSYGYGWILGGCINHAISTHKPHQAHLTTIPQWPHHPRPPLVHHRPALHRPRHQQPRRPPLAPTVQKHGPVPLWPVAAVDDEDAVGVVLVAAEAVEEVGGDAPEP